jgi:serine/threonine protein kinase
MQPDENFWKKCEGERIANAYELEHLLGCGAFGGVFRAVQIANGKKLNKKVAVKLMLSGTIQQEELNFALDLPSHQNLVQHHAGNNVEIGIFPMFYLVMELADCSLADFAKKRGGRISSVEAKAIVRDIAQGLKYLHELDAGNSQDKRYVHRDLKLLNVLQVGGVWKIADFGLSKALDRGTMQASKVAGTPYYMPPELFRNGYVSTKWDVWSLGVMIVEMLTGHFPFEAVYQDELERKIQRENPNLQGVSGEWLDIVKGCLIKDHERRWTAADVLKALESMVGAAPQNNPLTIPQPQPSSPITIPFRARPSPSRSSGLWGKAITLGLVSGGGFIIWQTTKPIDSPPITSSLSSTSTPSSEPPLVIPTATSPPSPKATVLRPPSVIPTATSSPSPKATVLRPPSVIRTTTTSPSPKETAPSKIGTNFFSDGLKKYNEKDFKGAISAYNEAIRLKPDYANAYINRGSAKFALGDTQGAIADYNEAIRLKPNDADAYINRGSAKSDLGDTQGGIADYNEAIRLKPDYAEAYYGRGLAKSDLGDKQGAIADYNEAIRINPDYAAAYYNRACVYSLQNNLELALSNLQKAIQLSPDRYLQMAKTDKDFDNIRHEVRFQELLR